MHERAGDWVDQWISGSGIQRLTEDRALIGGVYRGFDRQSDSYQYLYCEITGYYASAMINRYRRSSEPDMLYRSRSAAEFLLSTLNDAKDEISGRAFPHSLDLSGRPKESYYSFDNAMCLQGLLHLQAADPYPRLMQAVTAVGGWLLEMQRPDGSYWACEDGHDAAADPIFKDGCCLHAKHAIALLKLAEVTGNGTFIEAAVRTCDWVRGLQDE